MAAVAEGVIFARDLITEPANHLTTTEFANRIKAMEKLGLVSELRLPRPRMLERARATGG